MANLMGQSCCRQAPMIANERNCPTAVAAAKLLNSTRRRYCKASKCSQSSSSCRASNETFPIDQNNNNNNNLPPPPQSKPKSHSLNAAVKFKYQTNASREDLSELRKLLAKERNEQLASGSMGQNEFIEFHLADYERMMADDWLVTRFLLRGKKACERDQCSGQAFRLQQQQRQQLVTSDDDDNDDDHDDDDDGAGASDSDDCLIVGKQLVYAYTLELIKLCAKFRYDYRISERTSAKEFPSEWLEAKGMFCHEPDRAGNPTVYLRVALHRPKLLPTQEARHEFKRYMLYTIERCDQQLFREPGKAICCIFDMTSVAFENIDLELTTWMIKSFKQCSPKLLCYVIVYNPPWFFMATFKLICSTLLSNSKRQSVKFATGNEILNYIERDNLPDYLKKSTTTTTTTATATTTNYK